MTSNNVDSFLIRHVFSPVAWAIERWTGLNNYWQGYYIFLAVPLLIVFRLWLDDTLDKDASYGWLSFCALMWVLLGLVLTSEAKRAARDADKRPDVLPKQSAIWSVQPRLFNLGVGIIADPFITYHLWERLLGVAKVFVIVGPCFFIYAIGLYLCAVPRPPAQTKKETNFWLQPIRT